MKKLKTLYIFLFIVLLGLLIIPQFSIKLGDTELKYPNVDFTALNPNATLGNFSKGYGLYDSKVYSGLVTFAKNTTEEQKEAQLKEFISVIQKRINYSELKDIKVTGSKDAEGYKVNLQYPEYVSEADKLTQYLVAPGQISFENDPQVSQNAVSLKDTDIEGQIKSIYDEQYGNVLSFKFAKSALLNFYSALQNTNNYFLMKVDNSYFAVVQDPNYTKTQSADLQTAAIAVPFADIKLSTNVAAYTNIVRSYFLNPALTLSVNVSPNVQTLKRDFVSDKISYIAIFIIAGVSIIAFLFFSKNTKKNAFKFALMVLSYMVLVTFLLKFESATLSVSLILGFILGLLIMFFTVNKLLNTEEDMQKAFLRQIVEYGLFIGIIVYVLYRVINTSAVLIDGFGALLASILALLFLCLVNFKYILDSDYEFKLNPLKKIRK